MEPVQSGSVLSPSSLDQGDDKEVTFCDKVLTIVKNILYTIVYYLTCCQYDLKESKESPEPTAPTELKESAKAPKVTRAGKYEAKIKEAIVRQKNTITVADVIIAELAKGLAALEEMTKDQYPFTVDLEGLHLKEGRSTAYIIINFTNKEPPSLEIEQLSYLNFCNNELKIESFCPEGEKRLYSLPSSKEERGYWLWYIRFPVLPVCDKKILKR